MNQKVMNNISYGLYVLTASNGGFSNGCIINTLAQVTTSPNRVAVTVNKTNYTHYMIQQSGKFNVSIIDESANFDLFKHFGFSSGRWENKFYRFNFIRAENKIPYVPEHTNAYISCKVVQTVDLGTHTMFIADVEDGEILSDKPSMTYAYYHKNVKPKPKAAKSDDGKVRYVCTICGYIYEGELPPDFICPLCKHGVEAFKKL
ncbi:MAG: flavin reductase [Oscillospiraceae bacterium]